MINLSGSVIANVIPMSPLRLEIGNPSLIQTDGLDFYLSDRFCIGNVYFFPFLDSYFLCEILFHFLTWRYAGMR